MNVEMLLLIIIFRPTIGLALSLLLEPQTRRTT